MKKLIRHIFSIRNDFSLKIIEILGIKIKLNNNKYYNKRDNLDKKGQIRQQAIDKILNDISSKFNDKTFSMENILKEKQLIINYLTIDSTQNYLNVLFKNNEYEGNSNNIYNTKDDTILCWEIRPTEHNYNTIRYAYNNNKKLIFVGDSFLRSINTIADKSAQGKFKKGISFTFDDLTCYFDATRPSRLEQMLNDKNLIITTEQKLRARKCIDFIVKNHLTKYNHQPIYTPNIGKPNRTKVLVVDQTYGDMSILKGLGSKETFKNMLECAIIENPNADIIIKTHPDTIVGSGGYYTGIKPHDNIYTQTEAINPISLINYCDKVYVCTTQFGFEALMCGKEVHVFGMPFYAGWGLTKDTQACERRQNKRSLEEIFYITYILYSYYVNPKTNTRCEIEEAMNYLVELREEYNKKEKVINE